MGRLRKYKSDAERQRAYRRRKKASRHRVHFSSVLDVRETPADLFAVLDREFRFDLDACALPHNAKCARYYTPDDNALAQTWQGTVFINPPYGKEVGSWIRKAYESSQRGATVVCVVPARTDAALHRLDLQARLGMAGLPLLQREWRCEHSDGL